MENKDNKEKRGPISELMATTISKIHEIVDSNAIVGEPITTPDGVTLIPISRVSFGFGSGGTEYGKAAADHKFSTGGGGGSAKIEPIAFLIIKDGQTRMMPVAVPAVATVDRVLDMAPQLMDRIEGLFAKKKDEEEIF